MDDERDRGRRKQSAVGENLYRIPLAALFNDGADLPAEA
jgi:hypothetical protein